MRKIITSDVFKLARIIKKIGIKDDISAMYAQVQQAKKQGEEFNSEKIGIDLMLKVIEACSTEEQEKQIYGLLAGIMEKTEEDIKNQSLDTLMEDIKRIFSENNMTNFFKAAAKSMN